ncbi:hypothetical protein KIPB_012875, partial [Kipferlia bialata]|eukprot:g12875.t1
MTLDTESLVDKSKTLDEGALRHKMFKIDGWTMKAVRMIPGIEDYLSIPLGEWPEEAYQKLLRSPDQRVNCQGTDIFLNTRGVLDIVERRCLKRENGVPGHLDGLYTAAPCHVCKGMRLRQEAYKSMLSGKHIGELATCELHELLEWIHTVDSVVSVNIVPRLIA